MSELAIKALAVVLLVAGLIFGFNVFVDHQRDIGYQKRAAEDAVQLNADLLAAKEHSMSHLFDAPEYVENKR